MGKGEIACCMCCGELAGSDVAIKGETSQISQKSQPPVTTVDLSEKSKHKYINDGRPAKRTKPTRNWLEQGAKKR